MSRLSLLSLLLILGCTNQSYQTHEATSPSKLEISDNNMILFGVHQNFKGNFETQSNGHLTFGGEKLLKRYAQILKQQELPSYLLSLGNQGKRISSFDASILEVFTLDQIPKKNKNVVTSNILNAQTGKNLASKRLPKFLSLKSQNYITGVSGVLDYESLDQKAKEKISGLYFQDPKVSLLPLSEDGKFQRLALKVLMLKARTRCHKRNNGELICKKGDPLYRLLKAYPFFDLVFVSEAPFQQAKFGQTSIASVSEDPNLLTVLLYEPSLKNIFKVQNIKLCKEFFKTSKDCTLGKKGSEKWRDQKESLFKKSPAYFWGSPI